MKKKVTVELVGNFYNAGVLVESTGFGFFGPGKQTKLVSIQGEIAVGVNVKGAKHDQFLVRITINKVTKVIQGEIVSEFKAFQKYISYPQSQFNL